MSSCARRTCSRSRARYRCRSATGVCDQERKAFRAEATAISISRGPARTTSANGSSVAGFTAAKDAPVFTSWPSMIGALVKGKGDFKSWLRA
jgi:hypothetical protein